MLQSSAKLAAEAEFRRRYQQLTEGPGLLPYQLDIPRRQVLLALVNEPMYRHALFLDQRFNDGAIQAFWIPLARLLETGRNSTSPAQAGVYIFHIGHCGSTLISRLLGDRPDLLPLREPLVLRALAETRRKLGRADSFIGHDDWNALLALMLRLFARAYHPKQTALIKATSHCNNLLAPILSAHPDNLALGVYIDLETYLANLLRPQARAALYAFAEQRILDLVAVLGKAAPPLHTLSPARLGAMNWCASMAQYALARRDPNITPRLKLVDFNAFLEQPSQRLTDILDFLNIEGSIQNSQTHLNKGYLQTYAKDPRIPYTPELRARELAASRTANAADIDDALEWAHELVGQCDALSALQKYMRPQRNPP